MEMQDIRRRGLSITSGANEGCADCCRYNRKQPLAGPGKYPRLSPFLKGHQRPVRSRVWRPFRTMEKRLRKPTEIALGVVEPGRAPSFFFELQGEESARGDQVLSGKDFDLVFTKLRRPYLDSRIRR